MRDVRSSHQFIQARIQTLFNLRPHLTATLLTRKADYHGDDWVDDEYYESIQDDPYGDYTEDYDSATYDIEEVTGNWPSPSGSEDEYTSGDESTTSAGTDADEHNSQDEGDTSDDNGPPSYASQVEDSAEVEADAAEEPAAKRHRLENLDSPVTQA